MGFFSNLFGGSNELKEALAQGAFLVDVRTSREYKDGSIKGAVNIPLDGIAKNLGKLKGKERIVLFCRSGARSSMAKGILAQNGIAAINGGSISKVRSALNAK